MKWRINNPLTYVLSNLGFAIEELGALDADVPSRRFAEITALLEGARHGGERVRQIVRGLKGLASGVSEVTPTDIAETIHFALVMAHDVPRRATVRLELGDRIEAQTDRTRLAEVLIHLLLNASQSFLHEGPVGNEIVVRTRVEQHQVMIEVIDNGPGIAPDVLPRIYDPFFTTKAVGHGAGLGLSIVHSIVTTLGGEIRCETALGCGTTFRIHLLVASTVADACATNLLPATGGARKRGRLLVVDDEQRILSSFTRLFASEFEVVVHGDPRDALRCIQQGRGV